MIANTLPAKEKPSQSTRWITYTGALVQTTIPGLNLGEPVDLVVDLATLSASAQTIPALRDHSTPVGTWTDIVIDPSRGVIAKLDLLGSSKESHGLVIFDAARELSLSIEAGIPWQASIGSKPGPQGSYDPILAPTSINGRILAPDPNGVPCYVLRGGILIEISIVLWGADNQTRQLQAMAEASPASIRLAMLNARDHNGRPLRGFAALRAAHAAVQNAQLASHSHAAGAPRRPRSLVEAMLGATGPDGTKLRGFAALRAARATFPDLH